MKNYTITVNGKVYEVTVEEGIGRDAQSAPVENVQTRKPEPAVSKAAPAAGSVKINAPMPGKILDIKASAGQAVKKGEVIMILEAMKMENEIVAPEDGTVASILVTSGTAVEAGDVLAALN